MTHEAVVPEGFFAVLQRLSGNRQRIAIVFAFHRDVLLCPLSKICLRASRGRHAARGEHTAHGACDRNPSQAAPHLSLSSYVHGDSHLSVPRAAESPALSVKVARLVWSECDLRRSAPGHRLIDS